MTNILVVYYSLSGSTKEVAELIAAELDAFVEPIIDASNRSGFLGYMRSGLEALIGKRAVIKKPEKHPEQFDLVIVGSPVWVGSMATPVRSYLANHPLESGELALFCTSGGPKNEKALKDMAALAGQSPVASFGVSAAEMKTGALKRKVDEFTAKIRANSVDYSA